MTISGQNDLSIDKVHTKSQVHIPASSTQGAALGDAEVSPGTKNKFTIDSLYAALMYRNFYKAGHGLDANDVGKTLMDGAIYDDVVDPFPTDVLVHVIDADNLLIAPPGVEVTLPVALLQGGNGYSGGRYAFWNASTSQYTGTRPSDSQRTAPEVLRIMEVGATEFRALVRHL